MTRLEVENQIGESFKAAVEVATRQFVAGIVGETIEDALLLGYDKQKADQKLRSEIWWKELGLKSSTKFV